MFYFHFQYFKILYTTLLFSLFIYLLIYYNFVLGGKRNCNNETYWPPTRFGIIRRLRKQKIFVSLFEYHAACAQALESLDIYYLSNNILKTKTIN